MFISNPSVIKWKAEFTLTAISKQNGISKGASSIILQLNKLPYGGACIMTPEEGSAAQTLFTFNCHDWVDDDGDIVKYVFFASMIGTPIDACIGYTSDGVFVTQLPQGSDTNEYKMNIYVQIIDNDNGVTIFNFENQIKSEPNMTQIAGIFDALTGVSNSALLVEMFGGSPQQVTKNVLSLSAALNTQSKIANTSINGKTFYNFFQKKYYTIFEIISKGTFNNSTQADETARETRSVVRDIMISYVNGISISDINTVKAQASMITQLTGNTAELSRDGSVEIQKYIYIKFERFILKIFICRT